MQPGHSQWFRTSRIPVEEAETTRAVSTAVGGPASLSCRPWDKMVRRRRPADQPDFATRPQLRCGQSALYRPGRGVFPGANRAAPLNTRQRRPNPDRHLNHSADQTWAPPASRPRRHPNGPSMCARSPTAGTVLPRSAYATRSPRVPHPRWRALTRLHSPGMDEGCPPIHVLTPPPPYLSPSFLAHSHAQPGLLFCFFLLLAPPLYTSAAR